MPTLIEAVKNSRRPNYGVMVGVAVGLVVVTAIQTRRLKVRTTKLEARAEALDEKLNDLTGVVGQHIRVTALQNSLLKGLVSNNP